MRLAAYLAAVALGIASSALTFRHLGIVETGRLATVMALVTVVGGLSDVGLTALALREYSTRVGPSRSRFMGHMIGIRSALQVASVAVAVGIAYAANFGPRIALGTAIAGAWFLLHVVQDTLAVPLASALRQGWISVLQFLRSILVLIATLGLVWLHAGMVAFCAVQIPGTLVALLVTAALVRRESPVLPTINARVWGSIMRPLIPLAGAVMLAVIYYRIGAVLVSLLSSKAQTGYYGVSFRIIDVLAAIAPLVVSVSLPVLSRAASEHFSALARAMARVLSVIMVLACGLSVTAFAGAHLAVAVVAGPSFEPAVDVFRLHAVGLVGTFLATPLGYTLLSARKHREMLACTAVACTGYFGLALWLVPSEGAVGAAIALACAEFILTFAYAIALRRSVPETRFEWRLVSRVGVAWMAGGGVALAASSQPIAATMLSAATYATMLLLLRAVPPDVWILLPSRIAVRRSARK